jgi:hypothetical protein
MRMGLLTAEFQQGFIITTFHSGLFIVFFRVSKEIICLPAKNSQVA